MLVENSSCQFSVLATRSISLPPLLQLKPILSVRSTLKTERNVVTAAFKRLENTADALPIVIYLLFEPPIC